MQREGRHEAEVPRLKDADTPRHGLPAGGFAPWLA